MTYNNQSSGYQFSSASPGSQHTITSSLEHHLASEPNLIQTQSHTVPGHVAEQPHCVDHSLNRIVTGNDRILPQFNDNSNLNDYSNNSTDVPMDLGSCLDFGESIIII